MANPHKGEVAFDADGKTYTLRFSSNAICELEERLDKSFTKIGAELQAAVETDPASIRFGTLRAIFWAGLQDHHPDIDLAAAGDVMIAAGGAVQAMALIGGAFVAAFPAREGGAGNPPKGAGKRKAGTGRAS